jgi:signal transduction histidine kinase
VAPASVQQQKATAARPFATIYLRLFLPYAITLLMGTIIAWWIGTTLLYNTLEDRLLQQLHQAADVITQPNFPVTEPVLTRIDRLMGFSLYVFDQQGELQMHGDLANRDKLLAELQRYYRDWLTRGTSRDTIHFSSGARDYLLVLHRPDGQWQPRGRAVAVLTDLSDVRRATRRGGLWLAGLAACGISLLALLGHRIARSITVPVGELANMASHIAAGNRTVRVNIHRQDEVGALALSLNSMADRLEMYEQQVADQSRLLTLGEMSAKVAHEIRNPLTAIKMQLQLLEDGAPEAARPRLAALLDEVRRLELIVATTLQLGRPEQLSRQAMDLNGPVKEVLDLVGPQLQHRHIVTTATLGNGLPECLLDANRVKQILLNLINNAADELTRGGRINVGTRLLTDRKIALEVADSGPGIAPDMRESLFDRTRSGKSSGFGLGLRVTRELVELHGGTIEVAASELGGVLIRVIFPVEN